MRRQPTLLTRDLTGSSSLGDLHEKLGHGMKILTITAQIIKLPKERLDVPLIGTARYFDQRNFGIVQGEKATLS